MALPSLGASMIASKLIHETNESHISDGSSFKVFLSLFFSGVASLNGWLLRTITKSNAIVEDYKKEMSLLHTLLILGSRGMELVGGTLLIFVYFISL